MAYGDTQLEAMIARIRSLPQLAREAAPDAADVVREELERTIKAGTDATGDPWVPRKSDGGKPLSGADKAVFVAPIGSRVFVRVKGYIARHHLGRARGGVFRPVIPVKGIPPRMVAGIKRVLTSHFHDHMRGA